jgi:hypothetical protein
MLDVALVSVALLAVDAVELVLLLFANMFWNNELLARSSAA